MSMPIIAAASRSYEVARIALPSRVRVTSSQRRIIITNAATMVMIRISGIADVADVEALEVERAAVHRERVVVPELRRRTCSCIE